MRLAIIGQGLSFAAMIVPIVLGRFDALALIVLSSSISVVVYGWLSFSFPALYPVARGPRAALVSLIASHWPVLIGSAALVVGGLSVPDRDQSVILLASFAMLAGLTLYNIAMSEAVRTSDIVRINRIRLSYGAGNFMLTVAASLFWSDERALVAASAAAFLIASMPELARDVLRVRDRLDAISVKEVVAYNGQNAAAAVGRGFSTLAFQAGNLALGGLGGAAAAWAVVLRIAGGFSTVGQQVAAPAFEMRFAAALREGRFPDAQKVQLYAVAAGGAIGLAACVAVVALVHFSDASGQVVGLGYYSFLAASTIYALFVGSASAVTKNLVMAGGQNIFLALSITKLIVLAAVIYLVPVGDRILMLALTEAGFQLIYISVCFLSIRNLQVSEMAPAE